MYWSIFGYFTGALLFILGGFIYFQRKMTENEYVKVRHMQVGEKTVACSVKYFGKKLKRFFPEDSEVILVSAHVGKELLEDSLVYDGYIGYVDSTGIMFTVSLEPFSIEFSGKAPREFSNKVLDSYLREQIILGYKNNIEEYRKGRSSKPTPPPSIVKMG